MANSGISRVMVARSLCPLYEYVPHKNNNIVSTHRKTYFSLKEHITRSAENPDTVNPCALPADLHNLDVFVTFYLSYQKLTGKQWKLDVQYSPNPQSNPSSSIPFAFATGNNWDDTNQTITAKILIPQNKAGNRPLPWAFNGQLAWAISDEANILDKGSLPLELYVLSAHIPGYMKTGGIPLDLLHLPTLLPSWMRSENKLELNGWSGFVTQSLFHDSCLWYDVWMGQATYCGQKWGGTASSQTVVLWIDLWLSDMYGITKRGFKTKKIEKYALNCHDTANLTTAIASLGLPDEDTVLYNSLVEPFGFIQETYLIGRHSKVDNETYTINDLCNNPFYGQGGLNKKMKCGWKSTDRSIFNEHKITVLENRWSADKPKVEEPVIGTLEDPKVLDACTSLQKLPHGGTESLEDYIKNTVDLKTVAYWRDQKDKLPEDDARLNSATVDGIKKDPDILALAPRPALIRVILGQTLPESLYKSMSDVFSQAPYTLLEPCEDFTDPRSESLIVTWTVQLDETNDQLLGELHINVSRFYDEDSVKQAYSRRRAMLKNGSYKEDVPKQNGLSLNENPGFFMFWVPAPNASPEKDAKPHFFVTIDSTISKEVLASKPQSPVEILKLN